MTIEQLANIAEVFGMPGYFPAEPFGDNQQELVMITLWRDIESLKAFAGSDRDNPVVTKDEEP